jgi:hypothetical protein
MSTVLSRPRASAWGQIAIGATVVSAVGYVVQVILDFVPDPAIVGALIFFGLFGATAIVALISGIGAVVTGRKRNDHTVLLGLIAIAYVVLMQTIQSLWD